MGVDILDETCKATEFSSPEDYAQVMRERMQSAYQIVHSQLKSVFARAKRRYDVRVRECHVKVGDRVWYFSPRKYRNKSPKWSLQTSGPFEVVRKVNDVNYTWLEDLHVILHLSYISIGSGLTVLPLGTIVRFPK
jgi:hypothetical protein